MIQRLTILLFASISCALLSNCTSLIVAGTATGASASQDRRSLSAQVADQKTELQAINALFKDEELWKDTNINVISYNNHVLILGQAPTSALKQKASDAIEKIVKLNKVYNQIRIAAPLSFFARRQDDYITTKVKSAMLFTAKFPSSKVKVITENSEVFLMGLVTQQEADKAVDIARHIGGVKKVIKVFEIIPEEEK